MPKTGIFWLNMAKISHSFSAGHTELQVSQAVLFQKRFSDVCFPFWVTVPMSVDIWTELLSHGVFNKNIVHFWRFFLKTDRKSVIMPGNSVFMSTRCPCFEKSCMRSRYEITSLRVFFLHQKGESILTNLFLSQMNLALAFCAMSQELGRDKVFFFGNLRYGVFWAWGQLV